MIFFVIKNILKIKKPTEKNRLASQKYCNYSAILPHRQRQTSFLLCQRPLLPCLQGSLR